MKAVAALLLLLGAVKAQAPREEGLIYRRWNEVSVLAVPGGASRCRCTA